jgi:SAM-dependent methyltransferase
MTMNDHLPSLRQRFDHLTFQYQFNPFTRWVGSSELRSLRKMLPSPAQLGVTRALDFGCGTGRAAALMSKAGYRVTGYDVSQRMLARAGEIRGDYANITFTSDIHSLQGSWPLIVVLGVLDYYPDSRPMWQEWKKLLEPNSFIIVTVPNARSFFARTYTLLSRFTYRAFVTTNATLISTARSEGFSHVQTQYAFPNRWWGHTTLFKFRYSLNVAFPQ